MDEYGLTVIPTHVYAAIIHDLFMFIPNRHGSLIWNGEVRRLSASPAGDEIIDATKVILTPRSGDAVHALLTRPSRDAVDFGIVIVVVVRRLRLFLRRAQVGYLIVVIVV